MPAPVTFHPGTSILGSLKSSAAVGVAKQTSFGLLKTASGNVGKKTASDAVRTLGFK